MKTKHYTIYSLVTTLVQEAALVAAVLWLLPSFGVNIPFWGLSLMVVALGIYAYITYRFGKKNPSVRDRVGLVNARLRSAAGEVNVVVDRRCRELIKDFEQVSYKDGSSVIDKDRDRERTHLTDALGYLTWEEFGPKKQYGGQKVSLRL